MSLPQWNEPLADMLEAKLVYAVDSETRNKTFTHRQPGLELNLTCQGRGALHVGEEVFALAAGTLVFIPEPAVHRLEVYTPGRYVRSVLCIAPSAGDARPFTRALRLLLDKPPFLKPRCLYLDPDSAREVRNLISRIATESRRQVDWWQETALGLAYELLALSARLAAQPRSEQPPGGRLADETAAYVADHLDEDLSAATLARHFGVSREHLSRVFRQRFGITYQHYVLNRRVDAARRLLADTHAPASLLDIALAAGFQSHAHFSRVFRKHEGITPTQFRTLHRHGS
ncbi:MAG TPA: AraC family transcriptional regulator [Chthoniobacteraceae bacterium]|nr:AraC family transcriptional regulator [Chthoniobacteraceae bacterium]